MLNKWLLLLCCALPAWAGAQTAEQVYASQVAQPKAGHCLMLQVDLANSPGFSDEQQAAGRELRYRMAFNNVAEGWSWSEGAPSATEDYYRYKFLPLQSVSEARGSYQAEDKIGVEQRMQRQWRYDYFLAFDNLYDFYPRSSDDEAGFVALLPISNTTYPLGQVGLRAKACLVAPVVSESTTFWKATYGKPTDFTLKKRYLLVHLEALEFFDLASGELMALIHP